MYIRHVKSDEGFLAGYLPYLLRQADQALSAPFYGRLNVHGVARSEWRVLAALHEKGELRVADLAIVALSPQPTVTNALRRLEERGLVVRVAGTDDKRQRLVSITPAGASLAATLVREASALQQDALSQVGDLSDLVNSLKKLTEVAVGADPADRMDLENQGVVQ